MNVVECRDSPTATLSFVAGALLSGAWLVFGDALLLHSIHDVEPVVSAASWAPSLLSMFAFAMLALAPVSSLVDRYGFPPSGIDCTRLWIFCSLTLFFGAVIAAILLAEAMRSGSSSAYAYISTALIDELAHNRTASANTTAANATNATTTTTTTSAPTTAAYDDAAGEWYHMNVGYSIIGQTALIFASAGACLSARMQRADTTGGL